jgi:hypothetical protein
LDVAVPASEESAFKDWRSLMFRGKRLLVSAGVLALAFFGALILIVSYGTPHDQSVAILIGDYVVTLGIAVPGLILYVLRLYTLRSIRSGNAKVFPARSKLALVSVSWAALVIAVAFILGA